MNYLAVNNKGLSRCPFSVMINSSALQVEDGHIGAANLRVIADSETWLGFLTKERSLLRALLRRRTWIKGPPKPLVELASVFHRDSMSNGKGLLHRCVFEGAK